MAGLMLGAGVQTQAAEPVQGRWVTQDGKALVELHACGGKMLCGEIVRILKPPPGGVTTDMRNPDVRQRHRPLEGLRILTALTDVGSHWKGSIYDPESGNVYTSKLRRNADGTLKLQGCLFFICRTQIWAAAR